MDLKQNYVSLAFDLENQELESSGNCSERIYAQLLAIYLLTNDLPNAKLLWKRIPENKKKESEDLKKIWKIGQTLFKKNTSEIYHLIDSYQWPNFLMNIMKELKELIKKKSLNLIQKSYSYISIADFKRMLYIETDEELNEIINTMNWTLDGQEGIIISKTAPVFESLSSNQEHLEKLVEYVTYLEF